MSDNYLIKVETSILGVLGYGITGIGTSILFAFPKNGRFWGIDKNIGLLQNLNWKTWYDNE